MKLQSASDVRFRIRVQAAKRYLESGSLEEVAFSFSIHPITLRRWIKRYHDGGEENLKRKKPYIRHSKRFTPLVEKKIVLLKEKDPSITTFKAQSILLNNGIKASIRGIWGVWKRYNLVGFYSSISQPGADIKISQEIEDSSKKADQALNEGEVKKAARILNALPSCRGKDILKKIPDRLLSLSRQVDKLPLVFGREPLEKTVRKARVLRQRAEKKNLLYTAVRAGIAELFGAAWRVKPDELIILIHRLQDRLNRKNRGRNSTDPIVQFNLLFLEAMAFADIGRTKEAISCITKCEILCRRHFLYSDFYHKVASLYSIIGFRRKSQVWLKKGLHYSHNPDKGIFYLYLASDYANAGQYESARRTLKKVPIEQPQYRALAAIVQSRCALGKGKIHDAAVFANKALFESKKEGVYIYFSDSSFVLACCSCALGERTKAETLLKRVVVVLDKFGMKRVLSLFQIHLGKNTFSETPVLNRSFKLTLCLNKASKSVEIEDYRKAFNYAKSQQIMGLFHRLVLFFPEPVNRLIARGKPTGLPKVLLNLPVFQKNIPVYHLMFLGPVRVYRNGIRLRNDPTPIYASFIIHLGFKKRIELNSLYRNFWQHTKDPRGSLSHLLYGVRKYLRLLPGTLFIKQGFLHFKGYITTDYQFYEETMIRAKTLERAGEWVFAKKEYLRAFKLFRGEPFKKMYDPWSEHMRRVILNKLETEAIHFAKSCLEHDNEIRQKKRRTLSAKCRGGNMADAKKVLERVLKIIPNSEESQKLLETL
jgi:tetratricopeptide (TPR) repeat protein/transposase-like protein